MLLVKTRVAPSPIHGLGLFAEEFILAGSVVWKFTEGFDQTFTREQIEKLPEPAHFFLAKYAYLSTKTGRYLLDTDNGRYFNHSKIPNTSTKTVAGEKEDIICADKDIESGEEITVNYADQEADHIDGNILESFYSKYTLVDEVDPRLKKSFNVDHQTS